jgi:hypothetical protein
MTGYLSQLKSFGRTCGGPGDSVPHYVNDPPYAASSLLAVALKSG